LPSHTCKHIAKATQAHPKTKALSKSLQVANRRQKLKKPLPFGNKKYPTAQADRKVVQHIYSI
jgi:hypothetical protein